MRYYRRSNNMQGSVMTHLHRLALVSLCACMFVGCGSSSEPPPVQETVFDDMTGTLDKARGVQDTVDAHKQQTDRQLDAAEGQ